LRLVALGDVQMFHGPVILNLEYFHGIFLSNFFEIRLLIACFYFFDQRTLFPPGPAGIFQLTHHSDIGFHIDGFSDPDTPGTLKGCWCHRRH
jgi:hypothetical protein